MSHTGNSDPKSGNWAVVFHFLTYIPRFPILALLSLVPPQCLYLADWRYSINADRLNTCRRSFLLAGALRSVNQLGNISFGCCLFISPFTNPFIYFLIQCLLYWVYPLSVIATTSGETKVNKACFLAQVVTIYMTKTTTDRKEVLGMNCHITHDLMKDAGLKHIKWFKNNIR